MNYNESKLSKLISIMDELRKENKKLYKKLSKYEKV